LLILYKKKHSLDWTKQKQCPSQMGTNIVTNDVEHGLSGLLIFSSGLNSTNLPKRDTFPKS